MTALVLLLLVAAPRDADQQKVLDAWKRQQWGFFDSLATRFLTEGPGYVTWSRSRRFTVT